MKLQRCQKHISKRERGLFSKKNAENERREVPLS
jgi:hypothetical protein